MIVPFTYDDVYYSGDWHGKWSDVARKIKKLDLRDCLIVQVGDFGVGFQNEKKFDGAMRMFNQTLSPRNISVAAIRGNHDDPSYFDGRSYGMVHLIGDYSVLDSNGTRILCVGGAISTDRMPNPDVRDYRGVHYKGRKLGLNYWEDESFVLLPEKIPGPVDVVVTHSAPDFCWPLSKSGIESWYKHDPDLESDVGKERSGLASLSKIATGYKRWYYGHFHKSNIEVIDDVLYRCLDELEISN
jgi:DNA repair exonuclease SbcCD nuclease subunit